MALMSRYPDKYFDLAIVDPPYGIGADENAFKSGVNGKVHGFKNHSQKNWDKSIPTKEYFNELFRVSKNQIIWGGNYFTQYLKPVMSWIVWDKMQYNFSFSHGEMAWNSFEKKLLIYIKNCIMTINMKILIDFHKFFNKRSSNFFKRFSNSSIFSFCFLFSSYKIFV